MRKYPLFCFSMVAFFILAVAGCENSTDPPKSAVINIAAIRGVTAPVRGETPVTAITPTDQYTGTVTWGGSPHTGSVTTFAASTTYTATITLTAKKGYTLRGVAADFFTVAGAEAANAANSGVITAVFPQTASENQTPVTADYNITGNGSFTCDGSVKTVTITPKEGKSNGAVTVKYDGAADAPSAVGTYTVTFNVAAAPGWNAATGLSAGILTIIKANGTVDRFEYYWVNEHDSLVTTSGGATGVITGSNLTIAAQGTGYVVKQWYVNGLNTGQSGNAYIFSDTTIGKYRVSLAVEKDGKLYNTTITITVGTGVTVTFNVNGGTGTAPVSQTVVSGFGITLPGGSGLSRTGYTFGGWNTNSTGTGTNYDANSSYTPTGNITLYAKWNSFVTVAFDVNGGTGTAPVSQTVSPGSGITIPGGSGLSRTGYTFGGWNTNSAGTGTNYDANSSYTPTGNITLYAKWNSLAPNPPYLTATSNSFGTATLSWNAVPGAIFYKVYYSTSPEGSYNFLEETTRTTYISSSYLGGQHDYSYKVTAVNIYGEGAMSNSARIR